MSRAIMAAVFAVGCAIGCAANILITNGHPVMGGIALPVSLAGAFLGFRLILRVAP